MRVITGRAKGHPLTAPKGRNTRPTSDRVKEALFSSLQVFVPQATVLDLYAGSGALGIEALSRGAAACTFVESGRSAIAAIDENLVATRLEDDAVVLALDVHVALRNLAASQTLFDLVLIDPPYKIDLSDLHDVLDGVADVTVPDSLVRVELARRRAELVEWSDAYDLQGVRDYGATSILEAVRV